MKLRKVLSLVLVMAMSMSFIPVFNVSSLAANSDMDALSALGIDTSEAPDGYDPYSADNPYGKNTVEISTVYELYKVGLSNQVAYDASYYAGERIIENGNNIEEHKTISNNKLQSVLYGNEKWNTTKVSEIMSASDVENAATGTTSATGNYAIISSGIKNENDTKIGSNGYLKDVSNASTDLGSDFKYALSTVASGNFDGNEQNLLEQTAMVYTSDYSSNGGLYLRFGSASHGSYGSNFKELLGTTNQIGNPKLKQNDKLVENFAANPYQLQNYLQVTTGDWNNDGLDEVAVYIPEEGNSRIMIFALQLSTGDDAATAYLDPAKWSVVWTYYFREDNVVSNMVSLVSGDVNLDGTDDLAATWGYYYGPEQNEGSTAVVMFGAKGNDMLSESQQFDLTYGSSDIVRASFAFGDMAGSDSDVLILCGQSDADLKAGNTQTRYVAFYDWDGSSFKSNVYQNFDLFEQNDNGYLWPAMRISRTEDEFYSLPLCVSNIGVIPQGINGGGDLLYFDSLIIKYTESGLEIKETWDKTSAMQQDVAKCVQYVEYDAVSGDLTGQDGTGALITMTQTVSSVENKQASYTVIGSHMKPVYEYTHYYKNWLDKLLGIKTWYYRFVRNVEIQTGEQVAVNYDQMNMGNAYMVVADPYSKDAKDSGNPYFCRTQTDFSTSISLANTDEDSSYMSYGGKHYYTYTDPEVLTVLASPPYFSDLVNRDDLSGSYAESTTSYSKSKGLSAGANLSATLTVGSYVSFEQDVEVFGVKVASVEAEAVMTANFTFETEVSRTLEQTVTYSATSGEDMVAFYSIPMEIYEFTSYVADGNGGYDEVLTSVNIPHEASVRLLSQEEYEFIAKDYSVLPSIVDNVLTHTIGKPSSYPESTDGYRVIAKYKGTPSAVGFSSTEGGSGISQEIAMSNEIGSSFTASVAVEGKAGAGAGGVKAGIIAGAEAGAGLVLISTNGSSFSGEMQNMPIEAQPYGYGMNWRIFCYKYSDGGAKFPVVSYLVSDVKNPPCLPDDFAQDMSATTSNSVTLTWSYDKNVSGFKIYRYYEFPEGSGSYEVKFVPFTEAVKVDNDTGTYYFSYTDNDLSPYTEYKYQIKTVRAELPTESIYSEPMICRTKTEVGYPTIDLVGLNQDSILPIYPDADSTVTVSLDDSNKYTGKSYQWQKQINGAWTDISGQSENALTISNAGSADQGIYRCRINSIYYDSNTATEYYISAYSNAFTTAYEKRSSIVALSAEEWTTSDNQDGLTASVEMYSANVGHSAAPSGTVTFMVEGTDYQYSETVALAQKEHAKYFDDVDATKQYSTASLSIADLPNGVYTVSTYYSGSRIFKDNDTENKVLVVIGNGSSYRLSLSGNETSSVTEFVYGDIINLLTESISKDIDGKIIPTSVENVIYEIWSSKENTGAVFTSGSKTPYVGSHILKAYQNGTVLATQPFTVTKKPITVSIKDELSVDKGHVKEHPPVIYTADLIDSDLEALKLSHMATNSAGNKVELKDSTAPGKYIVTACTSSETLQELYNNYSVTYQPGTYVIIGSTHRLTAFASDFTDDAGTRPVGTVAISNETQAYADYSANTAVHLHATPEAGYQVDTWTAEFITKNNQISETVTKDGGNTFTIETRAQPVNVTVTFKPANIHLSTLVQPSSGGTIICEDENFSSGAYVSYGAEYPFTAIPEQGYHFANWQIISGGSTKTPSGTANVDGSNSLTVTMGNASMTVYSIFERNCYTLALDGDINAFYMFDHDNNPTTEPISKMLVNGTSIPGDTEITVTAKTGYQAADDAYFTVNEITTDDDQSYVFAITEDTQISLNTVRNHYAVNVNGTNGSVFSTVEGATATNEHLTSVEGGSTLTFTAHADRGYVFDHWVLNGENVDSSEPLTIEKLGGNADIEAVFSENTAYTATASVNSETRGSMHYTLYDIYGDMVGEANTNIPSGGLTLYQGESITLTARIYTGSVLEQWCVNDENTYTTQKDYAIDNISSDINAEAYLKAASRYMVSFVAMGESGSTLSAEIENESINSTALQYGGSELILTAKPATNYMVDYWTVTNGGLTKTEASAEVDENGKTIVTPVYIINPLKQNLTARAHFTTLDENVVTLPESKSMGAATITYVTPVLHSDNGIRDLTTGDVRVGGMVKMTFDANSGYETDMTTLETAIKASLNTDAAVTVEKNDDGVYLATVSNLTQDMTLNESDLFYKVYSITVPDDNAMGVCAITYVTPMNPSNDGICSLKTTTMPNGSTVKMTFTAESGYETTSTMVETAVKAAANSDAVVTVENNEHTYTATVSNLTQDLTLNQSNLFYNVYNITLPTGVSASATTAKEGESITLTVTPDAKHKLFSLTLDRGSLNEEVKSDTLTYSFIMPANDVTVDVAFKRTSSGSSAGGGLGGGESAPETKTLPTTDDGTKTLVNVTFKKDVATLDVHKNMIEELKSGSGVVSFELSSFEEVNSVTIPSDGFEAISESDDIEALSVSLPEASMTFDHLALEAIDAAASGDVTLKANKVKMDTLTPAQKALVGDRSVLDLTLNVGDKTVSEFGSGSVQVNVPYTLKPGEDSEDVVVWYLNDKGILESVTGQYDSQNQSVVFSTNHFSKYVIGQLPFDDVQRDSWYFDSVSFAYANHLFSGTSESSFTPDASMTRAMLVTVLWRMELEPDTKMNCTFDDVPDGQWYSKAVAWASENGIVAGFGDGLFGANDVVTREQMAVILMNYAKFKDCDVSATVDIQNYSDSINISSWAKDAMQWANAENLIGGTGNNLLAPKGNATRSQVATILMRLLENVVV